jgi:hypothetical protein
MSRAKNINPFREWGTFLLSMIYTESREGIGDAGDTRDVVSDPWH